MSELTTRKLLLRSGIHFSINGSIAARTRYAAEMATSAGRNKGKGRSTPAPENE